MVQEKAALQEPLLPTNEQNKNVATPRNSRGIKVFIASLAVTLYIIYNGFFTQWIPNRSQAVESVTARDECPALNKIIPSDSLADPEQFFTSEYKNFSVSAWAGAIRFPTVGYDDLKDVGHDDRWLVFGELHSFLKQTFPLTFTKFDVDYVNTYGLLMTLPGKNAALKPVVLMAHQDVVPVPDGTVADWTHPPFSGYFDGEYVWGRGSSDDKNSLIGILEATESLLKQGYVPERSIILSFGFDEEVSGFRGAKNIAKHLEEKLGPDSIYMIVDEGGSGIQKAYGTWFGFPGTGEKGYIDVRIALTTTGGHSSIPPDHTSIGIISKIITELESNPYKPDITRANPFYYHLQCMAKEGVTIDNQLKTDIQSLEQSPISKQRVIEEVEKDFLLKYVIRTSQAVDVIKGGIKINALPEQVSVDVNHRIAIESSVDFVKQNIISTVSAIAEQFDFGVTAFGKTISGNSNSKGFFEISALSELEPAPVASIINNPTWDLIGGTVKQVFEDVNGGSVDGPITIAPSIMTANTDTRHYWNLTKNIFRFTPMVSPFDFNIHTVDEHTSLEGHLKAVAFYYNFLRNVDSFNTD